jgi:hypothetical protein
VLNLYEKYRGSNEGLEVVDSSHRSTYHDLQKNHVNFEFQFMEMLFLTIESYRDHLVYDKNTIKRLLHESKEEMGGRILLSSDPEKTIEEVIKAVDNFLNGEEIDVTIPYVLYMRGLFNHMSKYGEQIE